MATEIILPPLNPELTGIQLIQRKDLIAYRDLSKLKAGYYHIYDAAIPVVVEAVDVNKLTPTATNLNDTSQLYYYNIDTDTLNLVTSGSGLKLPARFSTTGNIALTGLGVQANGDWGAGLTAGDRIFVKDQTLGQNNGIYVAAAGAWTRSTDFDESSEVFAGLLVIVTEGTTLADTLWELTTNNPIIIGTTVLVFTKFSQTFTGSGTINYLARYTAATVLGIGLWQDNGVTSSYNIALDATASVKIKGIAGATSRVQSLLDDTSVKIFDVWNDNHNVVNYADTGFGYHLLIEGGAIGTVANYRATLLTQATGGELSIYNNAGAVLNRISGVPNADQWFNNGGKIGFGDDTPLVRYHFELQDGLGEGITAYNGVNLKYGLVWQNGYGGILRMYNEAGVATGFIAGQGQQSFLNNGLGLQIIGVGTNMPLDLFSDTDMYGFSLSKTGALQPTRATIVNQAGIGGVFRLFNEANVVATWLLCADGNVSFWNSTSAFGLGLDTPTYKLDVLSTISNAFKLASTQTTTIFDFSTLCTAGQIVTGGISNINVNIGAGTEAGELAFYYVSAGAKFEGIRLNQFGAVGIGTATPDATAIFHVAASTTRGAIPAPSMTTAQMNAIVAPATSLMVYATDVAPGYYYYDGANWIGF